MTEKCGAIGALTVGGRVVGRIECDLPAGHDEARPTNDVFGGGWCEPTPHAVTLTWTPESEPDLDLFDADEHFDVEVPEPGECGEVKPGYALPAGAPRCTLPSGHDGPHVNALRPYAGQW